MAKRLPVDERLETAGQLVLRARIFYDIWRYYEGAETRPKILDTMNEYSEFFRFDPHAHFVSFIVHIAALFESRDDTINIPSLAQEFEASGAVSAATVSAINRLLDNVKTQRTGVVVLRHNLFAHRSSSITYADAFKKASLTPNQLLELTEVALQIVNGLLRERGLKEHFFNQLPLAHAQAMLKSLAHQPSGAS